MFKIINYFIQLFKVEEHIVLHISILFDSYF